MVIYIPMQLFRLNIPQYSSKDFTILVSCNIPFTLLMNRILFGNTYFTDLFTFVQATAVTFILTSIAFVLYGSVAIQLRQHYPDDRDTPKRLLVCLAIFFLMSAVFLSLVMRSFELTGFLDYKYYDPDFIQLFFILSVLNIFITFLQEGISRFEKYRTAVTETEALKKEYMRSQLLGLKSQANPHFLFNSLNTLSCLIQEDADKAESFLDEMSKVYRYLLRNNDEQLVSLQTEIGFIRSYYFLQKSRFCGGLELRIDLPDEVLHYSLPPLTLQIIVEHAITNNSFSREQPLCIHIGWEEGLLVVRNSVLPRWNNEIDLTGLTNIVNKIRLLCQQEVQIIHRDREQVICLPLIAHKEEAAV